ncbi:MAG: hypothetical protein M0004_01515 [Actinomycetota bacterium]|nr:hypothetical protein [Actinomycetota bacterium]
MISNTLVDNRRDGGAIRASMRADQRSSTTRSVSFTRRLAGGPPAARHFEIVAG